MLAGCADSRLAATNANVGTGAQVSSDRQAAYQTGYGLSSDGPTTDLYTELFGAKARSDQNAPAPLPAPAPIGAAPQVQTAAAQPVTAASVVPPEPAAPQAAPVAETASANATVYGIPSNGPTTDLYTELFRSKRPE
jgi:hypothetical protein